ncbi:MAG: hypothetical protein V3R51_05070 [Gammaproteobacteria bacterium]
MKNGVWTLLALAAWSLGLLVGYGVSSYTGVEPGYFQTAETGSYGASAGTGATEGISDEYQDYYKGLTETE